MVAYLAIHDLLDVSFGAGKEYYEEENDCLDDCEREYANMCMVMTPNMNYLMDTAEYPFELWRNLDRAFGVKKEVDNIWSESNTSSSVLHSNVLASTLSDKVVQVE